MKPLEKTAGVMSSDTIVDFDPAMPDSHSTLDFSVIKATTFFLFFLSHLDLGFCHL
jgi:hypothetical protein